MAQEVLERGFPGFTIPYVEAAYFTSSDYSAEITHESRSRHLHPAFWHS